MIIIITNSSNAKALLQNTSDWQWSKMEVVSDSSTEDGVNSGVNPTITITETDEGFLDSPMSIPLIFSSITIVVLIKRRKEI